MASQENMSAEEYHADPCETPSLSSSVARILLFDSPHKAWHAHPKLNPAWAPREPEEKFDLGTAAHDWLLRGLDSAEIVDAPDWRTKAAREARDAARAAGRIPLLAHRADEVRMMADSARAQLAAFREKPTPFVDGKAEQVLIWKEDNGILCRARLDWINDDRITVDDYKTTSGSANPEEWSRTMFGGQYDVQAAFHIRGLRAVYGTAPVFRFVVQENYAPFDLSIIALDPEAIEYAERKVERAIALWGECLESGEWPSYPRRTCYASIPSYLASQWLDRETRDENAREEVRS